MPGTGLVTRRVTEYEDSLSFVLNAITKYCALMGLLLAGTCAAQTAYPPLSTELSAEHPLLLFRVAAAGGAASGAYAQQVLDAWAQLPEGFKPYSALTINILKPEETPALLQPLQDAGVPVVLEVASGGRSGRQDLAQLEGALSAYTVIRGIEPRGMRLDVYDGPDDSGDLARANAEWLTGALDTAAKYGRFVHWPLRGLDAARFMAHPAYAGARAKMVELAGYCIVSSVQRGEHLLQGNAACMGLWLSGGAGAWGVDIEPGWYGDARLIAPGIIGKPAKDTKGLPKAYRASVLAGAMAGAWVYSFGAPNDLWFSSTGMAWNDVIAPVLGQLIDLGLAPRQEFVIKATPMALQLAEAADPSAFHANLHDLSPVNDAGVLWRAVFGGNTGPVPQKGGIPALPLLPVGASPEARGHFTTVVQADPAATLEQRAAVVDPLRAASAGSAFTAQVGRGVYVFNTDLAKQSPQDYTLPEAPAAVRGLEAMREGAGVTLTWPFREGDVSYNVYKRVSPQVRFTLMARGIEERRFADPNVPASDTVAYAVTALTNEKEPLHGTVNFGDFLVFSVVESRIAEEAMLTPVLSTAKAQPYQGFTAPPLPPASPQEGLDAQQAGIAKVLEERLGAWKTAAEAEDIASVMGLYADEYEDARGERLQVVKRAYEWFFTRCNAMRAAFQIRRWDFSSFETSGQVSVVAYCSLRGNAISDPTGRNADQTLELPRTDTNEVTLTFTGSGGVWRIQKTDPPLPDFDTLQAYTAGTP